MPLDGWVRLHRVLTSDPIWTAEPFTRGQAWVDLIMLANHLEGYIRVRGVKVEIKRGQVGYSEVALAQRWRWSRDKVRRWLKELEGKEEKIIQQKNNISSVITLINYGKYQTNDTANDTANKQQTIQQTNSKRYTNKNDKNDKNEKKILYNSDFEKFWAAYPNKKEKSFAYKSWQKTNIPRPAIELIIAAINRQKEWRKNADGEFRPEWKNPATWLNKGCWDDILEIEKEEAKWFY
ncbi:MAG: Phage protein [Candidatus Gottesmanbacteria bacterium GW2011_GWB1_49_7]|uniref:Phage protein n=1 Tax=Candidatus Gottesmanbacteria bacterium GW2011_GWB1_49_7 TaxID=1618448 RepID=A0A0G1Y990_9BACT|nr:MAG: Phage protein [Candidatus Gottesmanbacteria bacterium GW2011_GWB1_49_7]